jgi:hypothetical protein
LGFRGRVDMVADFKGLSLGILFFSIFFKSLAFLCREFGSRKEF